MSSANQQRALIALVQVLGLSVWFSATAVVPSLRSEWGLGSAGAVWLTASVQIGFVTGAVTSAVLNLADRTRPEYLLTASALCAATCTAALALCVNGIHAAIPLRFLTGMFLAGVYPVGDEADGLVVRAGRTRSVVRNPARRTDSRLCVASSHRRSRTAALAERHADGSGAGGHRGRRRTHIPPARSTSGDPCDHAESEVRDGVVHRTRGAACQPRLLRAHVGALRAVGMAADVRSRRARTRRGGDADGDHRVRRDRCRRDGRLSSRAGGHRTVSVALPQRWRR